MLAIVIDNRFASAQRSGRGFSVLDDAKKVAAETAERWWHSRALPVALYSCARERVPEPSAVLVNSLQTSVPASTGTGVASPASTAASNLLEFLQSLRALRPDGRGRLEDAVLSAMGWRTVSGAPKALFILVLTGPTHEFSRSQRWECSWQPTGQTTASPGLLCGLSRVWQGAALVSNPSSAAKSNEEQVVCDAVLRKRRAAGEGSEVTAVASGGCRYLWRGMIAGLCLAISGDALTEVLATEAAGNTTQTAIAHASWLENACRNCGGSSVFARCSTVREAMSCTQRFLNDAPALAAGFAQTAVRVAQEWRGRDGERCRGQLSSPSVGAKATSTYSPAYDWTRHAKAWFHNHNTLFEQAYGRSCDFAQSPATIQAKTTMASQPSLCPSMSISSRSPSIPPPPPGEEVLINNFPYVVESVNIASMSPTITARPLTRGALGAANKHLTNIPLSRVRRKPRDLQSLTSETAVTREWLAVGGWIEAAALASGGTPKVPPPEPHPFDAAVSTNLSRRTPSSHDARRRLLRRRRSWAQATEGDGPGFFLRFRGHRRESILLVGGTDELVLAEVEWGSSPSSGSPVPYTSSSYSSSYISASAYKACDHHYRHDARANRTLSRWGASTRLVAAAKAMRTNAAMQVLESSGMVRQAKGRWRRRGVRVKAGNEFLHLSSGTIRDILCLRQ